MSVEQIGKVWKLSKAKGSARLVLLAIADQDRGRGEGCWASVATIAEMVQLDRRNVQRAIDLLIETGEIAAGGQRSGGRGRTTVYKILLEEKGGAPAAVSGEKGGAGAAVSNGKGGERAAERAALVAERAALVAERAALAPPKPYNRINRITGTGQRNTKNEGGSGDHREHPTLMRQLAALAALFPTSIRDLRRGVDRALRERFEPAAIEEALAYMHAHAAEVKRPFGFLMYRLGKAASAKSADGGAA